MIATIMAEDSFHIGGGRNRFYPTELFRETANRIPNARLILYENRAHGGTFADRRFGRDVVAFLKAEHPAPR
jgi:hypothetical protein